MDTLKVLFLVWAVYGFVLCMSLKDSDVSKSQPGNAIGFQNNLNKTALNRELKTILNVSKYGVDGDPDFIVAVEGIAEPLCFHVGGQQGEVLRLLQYRAMGLFVNAKIIERNETRKTYLGSVTIIRRNFRILASRRLIKVNRFEFNWETMVAFRYHGHRVVIGNNLAAVTFRHKNVTLVIRRHRLCPEDAGNDEEEDSNMVERAVDLTPEHMREEFHGYTDDMVEADDTMEGGADDTEVDPENINTAFEESDNDFVYLGFYISDSRGLSEECHGFVGQFVHKRASVGNFRFRNGKKKVRLSVFYPGLNMTRHAMAILSNRDNLGTGRTNMCWLIKRNGLGVVDGNYIDYVVSDVRDTRIIRFH